MKFQLTLEVWCLMGDDVLSYNQDNFEGFEGNGKALKYFLFFAFLTFVSSPIYKSLKRASDAQTWIVYDYKY